jgi:prophage regulatory protein
MHTEPQLALFDFGDEPDRLLRYSELRAAGIGYSRQHLKRLEDAGQFPKRIKLSDKMVVWRARLVQRWLEGREGA